MPRSVHNPCPRPRQTRRFVRLLVACFSLLWAVPATAAPDLPPPAAPSHVYTIASTEHPVRLRARPDGVVLARVGPRSEFGSRQTFGVTGFHGPWARVTSPALSDQSGAWVWAPTLRLTSTRFSIRVDLSRRVLLLERGRRVVLRVTVGVGGGNSATPVGRFAVTDKLSGSRYGPYYGCCILALSARQLHLPAGWTGGDRIAIHGTDIPETVGAAASAGCLHARDRDLHKLMHRVPLGAPVFIQA